MLTTQEQEYGNSLIAYYTFKKDQTKIDAFVYADDAGKQVILKAFLTEVIKPKTDSEVAVYQEKLDTASAEVTAIIDYTKVVK